MSFIAVAVITFLAIFTQTVSGFGSGLVAMVLLPTFIALRTAVPLVALVSLIGECLILLKYRHALNFRAVVRLAAASLLGIPIGLYALANIGGDLILRLLGLLTATYSLYALLNLRLPAIRQAGWAYGFGFVSGVLAGLYNVGGPPVVIYGTCRRWSPDEFRSNLQAFFIVNSLVVIAGHMLSQNYTLEVGQYFLVALPAVVAGTLAGVIAARYINPLAFRRLVFFVLLLLGLRMLLV